METNTFLTLFEKSLVNNGFSPDAAHYHTIKVYKSLTQKDREKIEAVRAPEEVNKFSAAYTRRIKGTSAKSANEMRDAKADTMTISKNFSSTINSQTQTNMTSVPRAEKEDSNEQTTIKTKSEEVYPNHTLPSSNTSANINTVKQTRQTIVGDVPVEDHANKTEEFLKIAVPESATRNTVSEKLRSEKTKAPEEYVYTNRVEDASGKTQKIDKVKLKTITKVPLTPDGKKEYAKRIILASIPASIGVAIISLGVLVGYIGISALIAFFIAILIAVTVIGGASTLAGMIYGIITLFSCMPEGIYELGIAFIILGVTLALAIASYNIAVRWIPKLWNKYTGGVTEKLIIKLKKHLSNVRKECNKT